MAMATSLPYYLCKGWGTWPVPGP